MYLFGGNNYKQKTIGSSEPLISTHLHYLNMKTFGWSQIKTKGDSVPQRDEHTTVLDKETGHMVIFGGFCQGTRTNDVAIFNIPANIWTNVKIHRGDPVPCARSGHSAAIYKGQMYIFGGKNDDAEKLDDLWVFNIAD